MSKNIFVILLAIAFTGLFMNSCKKWEDHTAVKDPLTGKDLFTQISEEPDLSRFTELLMQSGYDRVIASSQMFTVFAPVNSALATLDPAIVADGNKLRMFVGNHITHQLHLTAQATAPQRLQMVNGKYNNMHGAMFEDAAITNGDRYAKNGLLHIVDKMVPALPNAWEYIETDPGTPAMQRDYLLSATDSTGANMFLNHVADLRDESKQYTFFMLTDDAWNAAIGKFKPFFVTGTADSTADLSSNAVVSDLVVDSVYQPGTIPDTIISRFNTKVGIDKSAIVKTVKTSNGIVYIMSKVDVRLEDKFQQYIIQAENYNFSRADRRNNTYFRDRFNPLTGRDFRDVLVFNHGVAQFYLGYRIVNVPSMSFKAYWVAFHDSTNNYTGTFNQKIGIGDPVSPRLGYKTVSPGVLDEIYLGEFKMDTYSRFLNIYLTADNTTNANTNMITADYIRLEPVF